MRKSEDIYLLAILKIDQIQKGFITGALKETKLCLWSKQSETLTESSKYKRVSLLVHLKKIIEVLNLRLYFVQVIVKY
jgi:hypothetical protein